MHTISQLVDAARSHSSIQSDYRLAKIMEVTVNTVANWRHGRTVPDELNAFRLSELACLDPFYVLACVQAERTTKPEAKTLWITLAKRLESPAAAALIAIFAVLLTHPEPSQAVDFAGYFSASMGLVAQFPSYTLWKLCCFFAYFGAVANFSRLFPRI